MKLTLCTTLLLGFAAALAISVPASSAEKRKKPVRPTPPTRPFDEHGAPTFTRLDGQPGVNPPVNVDGDFLIGPDYVAPAEAEAVEGVPQGTVHQFIIDSKDCKLFNPGIARDVFGTVDPDNAKTLIVKTHPIDYERAITVYIPAQYVPGTEAPFIVKHDGPKKGKSDAKLARIFDNLIAQKRIPALIGILISNGGGDAQGHERGREYDTMSGLYAEFIEHEVLPLVRPAGSDEAELLTVCSAAATAEEALRRKTRWPEVAAEEMEGFSVALAGVMASVPVTIVRGISNVVGISDPRAWKIDEAIAAVRELVGEILERDEWVETS